MGHTKRWKKLIPPSFRSPYFLQGDLGFFSYDNKSYGSFFLGVNTFTGKLFVTKISNNKMETLILAIGKMLKVRDFFLSARMATTILIRKTNVQDHNFRHGRVLLFDGESGLKSKKAQQILYDKYKLVVHADSGVKRGMAERAIKGKIRNHFLICLC
jgi:hypothetical protein